MTALKFVVFEIPETEPNIIVLDWKSVLDALRDHCGWNIKQKRKFSRDIEVFLNKVDKSGKYGFIFRWADCQTHYMPYKVEKRFPVIFVSEVNHYCRAKDRHEYESRFTQRTRIMPRVSFKYRLGYPVKDPKTGVTTYGRTWNSVYDRPDFYKR